MAGVGGEGGVSEESCPDNGFGRSADSLSGEISLFCFAFAGLLLFAAL